MNYTSPTLGDELSPTNGHWGLIIARNGQYSAVALEDLTPEIAATYVKPMLYALGVRETSPLD